jgi:hypothetical protein
MQNSNEEKNYRPEEKAIIQYKEYLDKLADQDPPSSDIFSNKGEAHASILMEKLLSRTTEKLDMYCTGLRPGILCGKDEGDKKGWEGAYWHEFKKFFHETIKSDKFKEDSIRILIQTEKYINNAPFRVVRNALNDDATRNKIKIHLISEDSKRKIENALGGSEKNPQINFAIFDGQAFRLEYEADSYRAIGSFNTPSWKDILTSIFKAAFEDEEARDITDNVRNLPPFITNTLPANTSDTKDNTEKALAPKEISTDKPQGNHPLVS